MNDHLCRFHEHSSYAGAHGRLMDAQGALLQALTACLAGDWADRLRSSIGKYRIPASLRVKIQTRAMVADGPNNNHEGAMQATAYASLSVGRCSSELDA